MLSNKIKAGVIAALLLASFLAAYSVSIAAASDAVRAEAYYKQGYLYYSEKNYNLAIEEYNKAVLLDPSMAKAYYWRGKSHYMTGQTEQARTDVTKALNLSPNYDNWPTFLKKMDPAKPITSPTVTKPVAPVTPPTADIAPLKNEGPRSISIDLRAVDISYAFRLFSRETGENIVVSDTVRGKITLSLNNVTTEEAFNAILKAGNCSFVKDGNIIRIIPSGEPKKITYLQGGIVNKTYTINYIKSEDMASTLGTLLPEGTKILVAGSNRIVIEGVEEAINRADDIIGNLDCAPKQVMVEARIIELTNSNSSALGMNFKFTDPNNPASILQTKGLAAPPTASTATGLYYSVSNQNMDVLLEALSVTTGYDLLSSPKVMALNGEKAEIITGQRLGYKVKTITDTGLIESVEFLDVGTKLVFTPFIKDTGYIIMDIHPEISEGSIVNDLPQKKSTETTTQLMVKDGETIIIGGLMKDFSQKVNKGVPFLSDIPFIGVPFRRVELVTEKREIMVLISPRITTSDELNKMGTEIEKFKQRQVDERKDGPMELIK